MWHHPDLHGAVQQGLPVQSGTLHHPHEQVVHQVIYCTHLHAYAMRFFWEQHGMVLRQGKKTLVVTKECSNRGTMTKSSRGASKRSCSQTAPSVPGVKKMKRLMQQKLVFRMEWFIPWVPQFLGSLSFLMTEANLPHFVGNGESGDISPPDSPVRPPVKASSLRRSSGGNDKSSKSIHNKCLSWEFTHTWWRSSWV